MKEFTVALDIEEDFCGKDLSEAIKEGIFSLDKHDLTDVVFVGDRMKDINWIAREIRKELGWTNGWVIEVEQYEELCQKVAEKILERLNK